MKTTQKILMLLLGAIYACAAFAGLIGIFLPTALLGRDVAFSLLSVAGLLFISVNDHTRPAPIALLPAPAEPCRDVAVKPSRDNPVHSIHGRKCSAA